MGTERDVAVGSGLIAVSALACAGATALAILLARKSRANTLRGKVVLITGSSRGLGLAMAQEFGKKGAKLALTARDPVKLDRARMLLIERNVVKRVQDIFVLPADLRNAEQAERLVQETTKQFGHIDILINNAGVITAGPIENQTIEDFRNVMNTNFFAAVHCSLSVLPQMLARREGAIVNIASIGGKIAVPHMLPYTASKFAVVGFSEGLSSELRMKGVRVTTICPGLMRTGSHLHAQFKGDAEREYQWFSLAASLPVVSTSARYAARQIMRAVISGKTEVTITPQAQIAARLGNLFPAATACITKWMNFLLPSPVIGPTSSRFGYEVRGRELRHAVALGNAASRRYNQTRHEECV